jgi:hypothetical protein
MYLVDHPGAIQPPPKCLWQCQLQFVNNSKKKMEKKRKQYLKPDKSKQLTVGTNEIFWSFYLLHVFFKFKQLNNAQNKF